MGRQKTRREIMIVEVHLTTGEIAEIASTLRKLHRDTLEQYSPMGRDREYS